MSSIASPMPSLKVSASDRLGLTLFFAAAAHALIILGVSFTAEERANQESTLTFEVTLVHSKSDETPKDADYLAQANQKGGGTMQEKLRPSSPYPNRQTKESERGSAPEEIPITAAPLPTESNTTPLLTTQNSSRVQTRIQQPTPNVEAPPTPTAAELMVRSREIARLSAEIRENQQIYAKMPREKVITANTKEYEYAAYEEAWRMKVEGIGNLNYPEEAKLKNITGNLLLAVTLRADGSIQKVQVRRSSGKKVLDDAAVRIVKMAAPYSPFPDHIKAKQDLLTIVRTWQFDNQNRLSSR